MSQLDDKHLNKSKQRNENIISNFASDGTIKWLCRKGDYVIWFTWNNVFVETIEGLRIKDIWEMKDGDFLSITNRVEDMPKWFSLHPTEVCNKVAYDLLAKFNKGEYPEKPIEAQNIWRLKIGDRLAWLRQSWADSDYSVASVLAFRENALVIGENMHTKSSDELIEMVSLIKEQKTETSMAMIRNAVEFVRQMGVPREYAHEWMLG
jgi:hypothetical protein